MAQIETLPRDIMIDVSTRPFGTPCPFEEEGEPYDISELLAWSSVIESQVRERLLLEQIDLVTAAYPGISREEAERLVTSTFPASAASIALLDQRFFNPLPLTNENRRYLGVLGLMSSESDMQPLSLKGVSQILAYLNRFAPSGYKFVIHMPSPTEEEIERGWAVSTPIYRTVHLYLVKKQLPEE